MTELTKAEDLIFAADKQGIQMGLTAADTILGYMEGHDYMLMVDQNHQTKRHDQQDGEDHGRDEEYSVKDALQFCLDMAEDLLEETENADESDAAYIAQLEKNCAILSDVLYGSKSGSANYEATQRQDEKVPGTISEEMRE